MRRKAIEIFGETRKHMGQDESDTDDKKQSRRCSSEEIVFFEKNLNKIVNLHRKIYKGKLGKDSITSL